VRRECLRTVEDVSDLASGLIERERLREQLNFSEGAITRRKQISSISAHEQNLPDRVETRANPGRWIPFSPAAL
jgi:hypothetical protein